MKLYKFFILLFVVVLSSCEKEEGNGSVLVTVKYNGKAVEQASIYLKRGNDTTIAIPPTTFDKQTSGDAIGQAYFDNLQPDIYTIYGKGYSQQKGGQVSGKTTVTITKRFRENSYDVTVNTQ